MLAGSLTFLTPWAAPFAAAAIVPVAGLVLGARRADRVRSVLRLPPAPRRWHARRSGLLVATVALLTLAAMQPVLRVRSSQRARTDAQAFVVLDTSRSMAAAPSRTGTTRLARAKQIAILIASRLGGIPLGVATFTDRVLPDLFPTPDRAVFDSTVRAVAVDDPPPRDVNTVATTFGALGSIGTQGFFPDTVRRRAVILVTDGESRPFGAAAVGQALTGRGIALAIVRVGAASDRVYGPNGTPEANYRPDPAGSAASIAQLSSAVHEPVGADPVSVVERALRTGPTRIVGSTTRTRTLAPIPALLALVPLLVLLAPGLPRRLRVVSSLQGKGPSTRRAST
jgi:hypothetical protein